MLPATRNLFHAFFLNRSIDELVVFDDIGDKSLGNKTENNVPSTFIKDIGRKSLTELGLGGLFLGM